jgi:hypothetical protein
MQLGWVGGGTGNCIPGSLRERRAERELLLEPVVSAHQLATIYTRTSVLHARTGLRSRSSDE